MAIDVTEATFDAEVIRASERIPVVVDFWAEWCGPCRTLGPVLEKAAAAREGEVILAKVDVDTNQALGARYGVQGVPAVKAFRGGRVESEFVGAQPPAQVEAFMDSLVPSEADRLRGAGDEDSLRAALELEPNKPETVLALARILRERGDTQEAADLLATVAGSFEVDGLRARIVLLESGDEKAVEAVGVLDGGDEDRGLDLLLALMPGADAERRDEFRRVIVGALAPSEPDDSRAREYRRRLGAALY